VEDNDSLESKSDLDANWLVGSLANVHLVLEDILQVSGLPGGGVGGLELADETLGQAFNKYVRI